MGLSESSSRGFAAPFGIPDATVTRLPVYLRVLSELDDGGRTTVSSETLARLSGVTPAQLRKDLSLLGSYGTRGVGYDVAHLHEQISLAFGATGEWTVVIVGAGNLGRALSAYPGFAEKGFRVAALLDAAPDLVGTTVAGLHVEDAAHMEDVLARTGAEIAVIAVPAAAAQGICDRLVAAGIRSILSFAPTVLHAPEGVHLRKVDVASELQILAFHEIRASRAAEPVRAVATEVEA